MLSHHMAHDAFGGWIHVKAESLDDEAILQSLKAGRFYSSQGPTFNNIECIGDEILIECSAVEAIMVTGRGSRSPFCLSPCCAISLRPSLPARRFLHWVFVMAAR